MENLKYIEILNNIKISGFKNFGYIKDNNVCYLMSNLNTKILQITIHCSESTKDNDEIISIYFNINFTLITEILNKSLKIECNPDYPYWCENADTITIEENLFFKINNESNRAVLKHTMNEQDINEFYSQILYIYNNFLQPFVNYYNDIEIVNNEIIEQRSSDEWCNYIPGETIFKSLIIMKICKNKRYDIFLTEYKSNIEKAIEDGNSRYVEYYNKLVCLTNYLESNEYKEFYNFS